MVVLSVPIRVNGDLRPSKLVKSIPNYVKRSILTMLRISIIYRPFKFLMKLGALVFALGLVVGIRYLWYLFGGSGGGHVQSLILASILLGIGFQTMIAALIADLSAVNRSLLEDIEYRAWKSLDKRS